MKKDKKFFSASEESFIADEYFCMHSQGITGKLLKKYKPSKGIVTLDTKNKTQKERGVA